MILICGNIELTFNYKGILLTCYLQTNVMMMINDNDFKSKNWPQKNNKFIKVNKIIKTTYTVF